MASMRTAPISRTMEASLGKMPTTSALPLPTAYMVTPPPYAQPPPMPPPVVPVEPEMVMGIPKDLLLPASIGALAAVILGVFTISRLTR